MIPLYLVTIGGFTFSGRELAIVAVVVIVVAALAWFLLSRSRRG